MAKRLPFISYKRLLIEFKFTSKAQLLGNEESDTGICAARGYARMSVKVWALVVPHPR